MAGQPFDEYLAEHVFEPLGMEDTTSVVSSGADPVFTTGHVTAYGTSVRIPEMVRDVGGSGGVISTAHDMARWLAMQQRGSRTPAPTGSAGSTPRPRPRPVWGTTAR